MENWYDIPAIFVGSFIGLSLADALSLWIKRKLGWIE